MDFKLLRIAFVLLLPLLWVEGVWAVECPQTDYRLTTQAEVDALGATGCDYIAGELLIGNSTDITHLDGLANITSVEVYLAIYNNAALTDLDGLNSITSVGDGLYIQENAALTNLDGLNSITSVGGELVISGNQALSNCKLMAPLLGWPKGPPDDSVDGGIFVENNAAGCNSIEEILDSYSDALPEIVALRLMNTSQGFLSSSSEDTDKEIPPAAREAPAKDTQDPQEPNAIPTLPMLGLFILSGLLGLFGIRRLAHR